MGSGGGGQSRERESRERMLIFLSECMVAQHLVHSINWVFDGQVLNIVIKLPQN